MLDSDPVAEYDEMLLKTAAQMRALREHTAARSRAPGERGTEPAETRVGAGLRSGGATGDPGPQARGTGRAARRQPAAPTGSRTPAAHPGVPGGAGGTGGLTESAVRPASVKGATR